MSHTTTALSDGATPAQDTLLGLVVERSERVLDAAAEHDRAEKLDEVLTLCADLELFARAAKRAGAYPLSPE